MDDSGNTNTVIDIDDPRYRITPLQQCLAACTGALATSIFVTPLDVVKIRLQAQRKTGSATHPACYVYCNGLMDHIYDPRCRKEFAMKCKHFNGTMDAFVKISRQEGVTSLWSGLSPTLVLAIPATIAYFVSYEQFRLKLKDEYNKNRPAGSATEQPMWIPLVAGGTARMLSVTMVSPLELIRTKMQSTKLSYLEIGEALKILIRNNGILGLWKGVFATLLRDVPFSAVYWTSYELIKSQISPGSVPTFGCSFVAGAISGAIAATVTVPFDVVKTHQQIEIGNKLLANQPSASESTFAIMSKLHQTYGIRGLFTGLVPRLIKVAPACAIMIATFEYSKVAFNRLAKKTYPKPGSKAESVDRSKRDSNLLDLQVPAKQELM